MWWQSANHSLSLQWAEKTAPWEFQTKPIHYFFTTNNKSNLHFTWNWMLLHHHGFWPGGDYCNHSSSNFAWCILRCLPCAVTSEGYIVVLSTSLSARDLWDTPVTGTYHRNICHQYTSGTACFACQFTSTSRWQPAQQSHTGPSWKCDTTQLLKKTRLDLSTDAHTTTSDNT